MSEPDTGERLAAAPEKAELRALVERIAGSAPFRNAPRLKEFLLFVADRALSDHLDEISEQQIGHAVFRRAADYDTSNDNIVRVTARQLRTKLRDYFDDEGRDEALVMEIPKGAYVPHFRRRLEHAAPGEMTAEAEPQTAPAARLRPGRGWQVATVVLGGAVLVLGAALLLRGRAVPEQRRETLADLVVRPNQQTMMVLADSGLVLLHQLTGVPVTPEEYAERRFATRLADQSVPSFLSMQQLTSIADVGLAVRLLRVFSHAADRIVVAHARNISARNLKEGNLLLLGGPRSNPWVGVFEERMNFRFDFSGGRARARIVNRQPWPGEAREYESAAGAKGYARLALAPNLTNTGKVLLLGGTTIEATEAAAEFLMAPGGGTDGAGCARSDRTGFGRGLRDAARNGFGGRHGAGVEDHRAPSEREQLSADGAAPAVAGRSAPGDAPLMQLTRRLARASPALPP